MSYEPHTERLDPDEQCDLPPTARGVSVERDDDGDEYVVHYLDLTDETREAQRAEVRELIEEQPSGADNVEVHG